MKSRFISFLAILCAIALGHAAMAQTLPPPVTDADYRQINRAEAELGQLLFYDPILSGNRNIACATCHHPRFATGDGVALSLGEGGIGLGPARRSDPQNPPEKRIPRNSPALFNLGAHEFTVLFHDGRLEADETRPGGLRTPMDADMLTGFNSALSAQTLFPVLSRDEMAGGFRENEVARAVRQGRITGPDGAWDLLSRRVSDIFAYAAAFSKVYPHVETAQQIAFTDISNALAAFMEFEWRADDAPFDAVLRGGVALDGEAAGGMTLFYGSAGCSDCHSGPFQTDHKFHAMGAIQIGPGKAADFETHQRDEGRFRVTGNPSELYAFRTPSLRNVLHTAPYGHAGAHRDLAAFLKQHSNPAQNSALDPSQLVLPEPTEADLALWSQPAERTAIQNAVTIEPVNLSDSEIDQIIAFLNTLTDEQSLKGRLGIPDAVPSGLPVP